MKKRRDLLTLFDLSPKEILSLIRRARELKKNKKSLKPSFKGKILGMIFEKSSTRTRVSFEAAMCRLGGTAITIDKDSSQIGRGESYADTARVLSRYLDALMLRAYSQKDLEELASHSPISVINGLTDDFHPCQLLADMMTIVEHNKILGPKTVISYVGDGNNMANTWIQAAALLKFQLRLGCPKGFWPTESVLKEAKGYSNILVTDSPIEAVKGVDVINTDTWFSMGQEVSDEKRKAFERFQVNAALLKHAKKEAIVLHCLPAHRGEEITDEVMDGPQSVVFDEAENRLWAQMALLELFLT